MASAVGVVHLGDDVPQRPLGVVTPVEADRVEHVSEDSGLHERGDSAAAQFDALVGEKRVDALPQSVGRLAVTEVVARLEPSERPQPSGSFGNSSTSTNQLYPRCSK